MPRTTKNRSSADGLDSAVSLLEAEARAWAARARTMLAAVATMRKQLREVEGLRRGAGSSSVARVRRGPGRPATARRTPSGRSRARARAPRGQGTGSIAAAILREWGRPAKVNELLAELAKRGVTVGGRNPYNTLTATLMQRSGVKKAGPGMFAASDGGAAESAAEATPRVEPERKARKPRKARGPAKAGAKKQRMRTTKSERPAKGRPAAKKARGAKKPAEAKTAEPEKQEKATPATEAPTS